MKDCPIAFAWLQLTKLVMLATEAHVSIAADTASCRERKCAWWDDERKCCGVKAK